MRVALWAYITAYVVGFSFLLIAERSIVPKAERDSWGEWIVDLLMVSTGLVGMVLYALQVDMSSLKRIWLLVSFALIAGHGVIFIRHLQGRRQLLASAGASLSGTEATGLELGLGALLLPSLVVNVMYAIA